MISVLILVGSSVSGNILLSIWHCWWGWAAKHRGHIRREAASFGGRQSQLPAQSFKYVGSAESKSRCSLAANTSSCFQEKSFSVLRSHKDAYNHSCSCECIFQYCATPRLVWDISCPRSLHNWPCSVPAKMTRRSMTLDSEIHGANSQLAKVNASQIRIEWGKFQSTKINVFT